MFIATINHFGLVADQLFHGLSVVYNKQWSSISQNVIAKLHAKRSLVKRLLI